MGATVKDAAEIFKALGDESRLTIVKLIAATGNMLCVGMLARRLNISQPAVSQHLKILKNAGIVTAERRGMHMHYTVAQDFMAPYGVDTAGFLRSFGAELDHEASCEYKDQAETCDTVDTRAPGD